MDLTIAHAYAFYSYSPDLSVNPNSQFHFTLLFRFRFAAPYLTFHFSPIVPPSPYYYCFLYSSLQFWFQPPFIYLVLLRYDVSHIGSLCAALLPLQATLLHSLYIMRMILSDILFIFRFVRYVPFQFAVVAGKRFCTPCARTFCVIAGFLPLVYFTLPRCVHYAGFLPLLRLGSLVLLPIIAFTHLLRFWFFFFFLALPHFSYLSLWLVLLVH